MAKMKETILQISIDPELKVQADTVFRDIGLDIESAIKLFLKQSVIREKLPFKIKGKKKTNESPSTEIVMDIGYNEDELAGDEPAIINDLY